MPNSLSKTFVIGALLLVSAPALAEAPAPAAATPANAEEPAAETTNPPFSDTNQRATQILSPGERKLESPPPEPAPPPPSAGEPQRDTGSTGAPGRGKRPVSKRVLHGFRLGYMYIMNYDQPIATEDGQCADCGQSMKQRYGLRSPNQFLIGYEVMGRLIGHDWLNVLLVGNVMVAGLEQSKFFPSGNFLIGFEFDESFQVGVGPNFTPERDKPTHMIVAAGWTPEVGSFHVPVHAFYIPDVDHNDKLGMTVGVNF